MKKIRLTQMAALTALAALAVMATTSHSLMANAQETKAREKTDANRWEYVVVSDVTEVGRGSMPANIKYTGVAVLCYMQESGCQNLTIEGADKATALAKAMAQLGSEGWELIGESPFPVSKESQSALFFKRQKR